MAQAESEPIPIVTIKRNTELHSWVYAGEGPLVTIPFSDKAPADSVVRYLRTLANGRLIVHVNLS